MIDNKGPQWFPEEIILILNHIKTQKFLLYFFNGSLHTHAVTEFVKSTWGLSGRLIVAPANTHTKYLQGDRKTT